MAIGTSIVTTIGAITNNIALSTVFESIIGSIIGVVISFAIVKNEKKS